MSLSDFESLPDDPAQLPPARRRRANRWLTPLQGDERSAFLEEFAHRIAPSADFYIFSFLAGLVLGFGLLLNAPSLLLLGSVAAPLLNPALGLGFATIIGSTPFFIRSLVGMFIGSALALAGGALAGLLARLWQAPHNFELAYIFNQLSWTNFIVLATGVVLSMFAMLNSQRKPVVTGVIIGFELYLPLAVAGFGLSSGRPNLWPDGLVVFTIYLAGAALIGAFVLGLGGLRPVSIFGYTLGGAVTMLSIILLIGLSSAGAAVSAGVGLPTPTYTTTPSLTPVPPSATPSLTPVPPTPSQTPSPSATPTASPTVTITPTPVPVYAYINASADARGANLRREPGFTTPLIKSYLNGTLVEVLPETAEVDGYVFIRVRVVSDGAEGWMLQSLLLVATPAPNW